MARRPKPTAKSLKITHVDPGVLKPAEYNPREINDESLARLRRGIETFGMVDPIIARRSDGLVIGGHQRLRVALDLGMKKVPVVYLDEIADDAAAALNVLLNNPNAQGDWDLPKLADVLADLDGFDATLTGFDTSDLEQLQSWTPAALTAFDSHLPSAVGGAWTPTEDTTTGEHAADYVGYDLGSVWWRTDGATETRLYPYKVPLPANPQRVGQISGNYSRSPLEEMEAIVRTYMRPGDRFLEVCAGWWTFSATAAVWGYSGVGVDIWDVSLGFANIQLAALPSYSGKVQVVKSDARHMPFDDGEFDFVYCNAPFFQLEKYGGGDKDLAGHESVDDWLAASGEMMAEMARVVKPGGLIVTVMADARDDGQLRPFGALWIQEGLRRGLILHDIVIQRMLSQQIRLWRMAHKGVRTAKAHEYVITFRREGPVPVRDRVPLPASDGQ